jgi:hypothetical protein
VVVPLPVHRSKARYWVAAVAAALLIVFGFISLRGWLTNQPERQAVNEQPKPQEVVTAPKESVSPPDKPQQKQPRNEVVENQRGPSSPRRVVNKRPVTTSSNQAAIASAGSQQQAVEVATDFFPISYGNLPNMQEGGQLVRVELPRSAVARFGLPVNMDRPGDRVKADVLVGVDGLAQAIRFVQ